MQETVYTPGETGPAGGIVFYVDSDNTHEWSCLDAAPAGWYDGDDPEVPWGEMGLEIGASARGIGMGAENTESIAERPGEFAGNLAAVLELNGYADWFLPSREEVVLMYEALYREGIGGLAAEPYWTSTERNADRAMSHNFDTGGQISGQKLNENRVRPIRAF